MIGTVYVSFTLLGLKAGLALRVDQVPQGPVQNSAGVSKEGDSPAALFMSIIRLVLFTLFRIYADMRRWRLLMVYESVSEGTGILVSTERRKSVTSHHLSILRGTSMFLMECRTLFCCVCMKFYAF